MIIQHNIMAINSHRQLGINNSSLSKNLEKLSSGYRINRAADDAAGLAISEKMRAQITGLDRAVLNAQDGASLIQTAEGALQEVHSMLNRMVELATQSANGTIQADDRQKIEAEVEALKEEIDRISESTNFNGIKLLDGSLSESGVRDINVENLNLTYTNAVAGTYDVTVGTSNTTVAKGDIVDYVIGLDDGTSMSFKFTVGSSDGTKADQLIAEDGSVYSVTDGSMKSDELTTAIMGEMSDDKSIGQKFEISHTASKITFTATKAGTSAPQIVSAGGTLTKADASANPAAITGSSLTVSAGPADAYRTGALKVFEGTNEMESVFTVNGVKFALVKASSTPAADDAIKDLIDKGVNVVYTTNANGAADANDAQAMANLINQKTGLAVTASATAGSLDFKAVAGTGAGLTMQVGDTAEDYQKITVNVDNMSSSGLGISGISMATQESAAAALDAVKSAIEKVSVNRGNLGALQNRLEHTINNLNVTSENMTAAESRIRDVDMAKEMMAFTKNNVLAQAAQAMLAQANQQPQQVLQLLR